MKVRSITGGKTASLCDRAALGCTFPKAARVNGAAHGLHADPLRSSAIDAAGALCSTLPSPMRDNAPVKHVHRRLVPSAALEMEASPARLRQCRADRSVRAAGTTSTSRSGAGPRHMFDRQDRSHNQASPCSRRGSCRTSRPRRRRSSGYTRSDSVSRSRRTSPRPGKSRTRGCSRIHR